MGHTCSEVLVAGKRLFHFNDYRPEPTGILFVSLEILSDQRPVFRKDLPDPVWEMGFSVTLFHVRVDSEFMFPNPAQAMVAMFLMTYQGPLTLAQRPECLRPVTRNLRRLFPCSLEGSKHWWYW